VIARCAAEHVNPGHPLGIDYPEYRDGLLVAVTEQRSRADIDLLVDVLGRALVAERSGAQAAHGGGEAR
jgi:glycine dehydrogenase subunit 1